MTHTLLIITGYGSVSPKAWKRGYLDISEPEARRRFLANYPSARDVSLQAIAFTDELTISSNSLIAAASSIVL